MSLDEFERLKLSVHAARYIADLEAMVRELAMDLENEIDARYPGRIEHPVQRRRYERDMDVCRRARTMLPENATTRGQ